MCLIIFYFICVLVNGEGWSVHDNVIIKDCSQSNCVGTSQIQLVTDTNFEDIESGSSISIDQFIFQTKCCDEKEYTITDFGNTSEINHKYLYFNTTSSKLKQVSLENFYNDKRIYIEENKRPQGITIVQGCRSSIVGCRNDVGLNFETYVVVASKPILFYNFIDERMHIRYERSSLENVPLLYVNGKVMQSVTVGIMNCFYSDTPLDYRNYLLSGKIRNVTIVNNGCGGFLVENVCTREDVRRYLVFDKLTFDPNISYLDCSCACSSAIIDSETTFNYPDCHYNHSLFDLKITSEVSEITLAIYEWNTIVFPFDKILYIDSDKPIYLKELIIKTESHFVFKCEINIENLIVESFGEVLFLEKVLITQVQIQSEDLFAKELFKANKEVIISPLNLIPIYHCGNRVVVDTEQNMKELCTCYYTDKGFQFKNGDTADSCLLLFDYSEPYNLIIQNRTFGPNTFLRFKNASIEINYKTGYDPNAVVITSPTTFQNFDLSQSSPLIIESSFTVKNLKVKSQVNNLNQNGLVRVMNGGSINSNFKIIDESSSNTCYELISFQTPISSISPQASGVSYVLLENKLLRVSVEGYTLNQTMECSLLNSNFSEPEGYDVLQCPCSSTSCTIKVPSSMSFEITKSFEGTIKLTTSLHYVISTTLTTTPTFKINTQGSSVFIANQSSQFNINTLQGYLLVTSIDFGMKKVSSVEIRTSYYCNALYLSGTNSECKICKGQMVDGECTTGFQPITNCISQYGKICNDCSEGFEALGERCIQCPTYCKHCNNSKCVDCIDNYNTTADGKCELPNSLALLFVQNLAVKCTERYYSNGNKCEQCPDHCEQCSLINEELECKICDSTTVLTNKKCEPFENGLITNNIKAIICKDYYRVDNGECSSCDLFGQTCIECNSFNCLRCNNSVLTDEGKCIDYATAKCEIKSQFETRCSKCIDDASYFNGTECIKFDDLCRISSYRTCLGCSSGYLYNYTTKDCFVGEIDGCKQYYYENPDRCLRCNDGKFLNFNGECGVCSDNCEICDSKDECYSCASGYALAEKKCIKSDLIVNNCKTLIPGNMGCAICNSGYYRNQTGCKQCVEQCLNCIDYKTCLSCNDSYFLKADFSECVSFSSLTNCLKIDSAGCVLCGDGYFVQNQLCVECNKKVEHCQQCSSLDGECKNCEDGYILNYKQCVYYTEINGCVEATNSKCSKCSFWYKPNEDGMVCKKQVVWWVILLIVILVITAIAIFIITTIFITKRISHVLKARKQIQRNHLFKMKRSNVIFKESTEYGIVFNTPVLRFDGEEEGREIEVDQESRDLICVGNAGYSTFKIQFSMKEDCQKYLIRSEPQLVVLPPGYACEFNIFITPLCSSIIKDNILLFSADLHKGIPRKTEIGIDVSTEVTTKLDPDELIEEKLLGEGSFGIVYLGTFRGNKVAIKKLKCLFKSDTSISEFEKEVSMLDKFRSEYIIYFYGAVFVPNKICMVTEFAQFGSIYDLMNKKKKGKGISSSIKMKFMIDAAKGIEYLHSNGILHRDIKPDNFLVTSLDENEKVNAKLTDFGSSRNVNMLMTNMTFTNGIGTPVYMAPEILNRKKYKMPADIYSFSITMYEIWKWGRAYPESNFRFPWDIADFVNKGNRLTKPDKISDALFEIIEQCWKQEPKERCNIEWVISHLEEIK